MDDSENGGNFSIMHKVHAVRKLVQQCPPDWLLDERELTRIFSDTLKGDVELVQKTLREARTLSVIPREGSINVGLRLMAKDEAGHKSVARRVLTLQLCADFIPGTASGRISFVCCETFAN
jgi:hypothetical protein